MTWRNANPHLTPSPMTSSTFLTTACTLFLLFIPALQHTHAAKLQRFDMLALTDFQQASHRLQETSSRLLARKHSIPGDEFGSAIASLGDIDDDGHWEFAVSAPNSDVGCGAIHVIRIKPDIDAQLLATEILLPKSTTLRCASALSLVGYSWIGKRVLDRHVMLASGLPSFAGKGAVLISTLNKQGKSVKEARLLQPPHMPADGLFGASLAYAGDIDGDGNNDLLIGAPGESAIYVAFLDKTGGPYGFSQPGNLSEHDHGFGNSLASLGDIDDDGLVEALVASKTAVYLLHFATDGLPRQTIRLQLPKVATTYLEKGSSLSFVGLDDNDDIVFALGTQFEDDGGREKGAVWIVAMQPDGHIKSYDKISETQGRFAGNLDEREHFGASVEAALDINKDGYVELLIGGPRPPTRLLTKDGRQVERHQRRGGIWIADIPGTRTKKVTKLALSDFSADCIYSKQTCTCAYRSGQRAKCLSLAKVAPDGAHCHERYCADSFACDCRGRDVCKIEHVTKTVFQKRHTQGPLSVQNRFSNLVPCAENNLTSHILSITA